MRRLIIWLSLLLISIFVGWEYFHFTNNLSPDLRDEVHSVLEEMEVVKAEAALDHLDATISGFVDSMAQRQSVYDRIDGFHGLRVSPENNQIAVYPQVELSRTKGVIYATGWLNPSDTAMLDDWLIAGRYNSLNVTTDPWIVTLNSAQRKFLRLLVKEFFALAGNRSVRLTPDDVLLTGSTTMLQLNRWSKQAKGWLSPKASESRIKLYPSTYHFPTYKRRTIAANANTNKLADLLKNTPIFFDTGSTKVGEDEKTKIETLAAAVKQTGGKTRFIIGGHMDGAGSVRRNIVLGRKRAENVIKLLVEAGVAKERFAIRSFGPGSWNGNKLSAKQQRFNRRVEILIK